MNLDKDVIFEEIFNKLTELDIKIEFVEKNKPWGGFFVIEENSAEAFIKAYYPEYKIESFDNETISPKILVVLPGKRLSWQYHFRRSELWKLIEGEAYISRSDTDEEKEPSQMKTGKIEELGKGERHRLIGGETIGIVAEIWRHTDKDHLSNENDIVRLQDDFGR